MKIKLASDGDAAIDRLLLLAVVQQKNEEERGGNSKLRIFPPLAISYTLNVSEEGQLTIVILKYHSILTKCLTPAGCRHNA